MKSIEINPNELEWYLSTHDKETDKEVRTTISHGDTASGISTLGSTQVSLHT